MDLKRSHSQSDEDIDDYKMMSLKKHKPRPVARKLHQDISIPKNLMMRDVGRFLKEHQKHYKFGRRRVTQEKHPMKSWEISQSGDGKKKKHRHKKK